MRQRKSEVPANLLGCKRKDCMDHVRTIRQTSRHSIWSMMPMTSSGESGRDTSYSSSESSPKPWSIFGSSTWKIYQQSKCLGAIARTSKAETASNKVKPSCFTNSPVFKADEASMNRTVTSSATIGDLEATLGRAVTDLDICDSIRRFMTIQSVDTARVMLM